MQGMGAKLAAPEYAADFEGVQSGGGGVRLSTRGFRQKAHLQGILTVIPS
jgi:hypothetical protein